MNPTAITTYAQDPHWRQLQAFFPPGWGIAPDQEPTEEWCPWQGHRLHLDCYRQPEAPIKVILLHGVGTHGRQMSMLLGAPLARRGYECIAVDMPEYGMSKVAPGALVRYDDWVQAGCDLVAKEAARDARPIVLYGLSAGGMLAFHIAQHSPAVKAIVGMTFLDQSNQQVRDETALNFFMSRVGGPFVTFGAKSPLKRLRLPMPLASKMHTLVNDKKALKLLLKDKRSAGNAMTLAFLSSYLNYRMTQQPEEFDRCPILLTQPAADRWTPLHLSQPLLQRITKVPVTSVLLKNAGHYPLEQPGLSQMVDAIDAFYRQVPVTPSTTLVAAGTQ